MKRSRLILINLIFLTLSSLLLRSIGLSFQVYLTGRIGAEGIGLFQLISSIYALSVTLATSGIRFAATRLASEEFGRGNEQGAHLAVRRCLLYALACGCITAPALYFLAPLISEQWIGDIRCVLSLRILSVSLPFLALSSVLGGYFTALQKMVPTSITQIAEQLFRIAITVAALTFTPFQDLSHSCGAVVLGTTAGEIFTCLILGLLYRYEASHSRQRSGVCTRALTRRMFHLAVPVAVSAYARTALSTLQHLLVPRGFRRSGASAEYALATYGVIQGMVFPVLFFPSAPLNVLSQLIVPELTESQVAGHRRHINYLVSRVFRLGFFFAVAISGIFFALAEPLGLLLYQSNEASFFLRVFAPIASVIYLDTLTDGMLKGLGQQVSSMRFNIIDALTGVICTWFLLPRFAISGYLFTVFATELLNFVLSFAKLLSITDFSLSLKELLFACISITCALFPAKKLSLASPLASLILQIIITILLYFCLLFLTGCLKREDLQWFRSLFYEPAALRQRPFRHR